MRGQPLTRRRVHMCPVCKKGCMCLKGWTVLDTNPSRVLTELLEDECDCCAGPQKETHGFPTTEQERGNDAH